MGLSASQGRMLLLTARRNDLEFRAQQISQRRLLLSQQLEEIAMEYENATSNRQMKIKTYQFGVGVDPTKAQDRDENLTYAALISGTVAGGSVQPWQSGIVGDSSVGTAVHNYGYTSTNAYRLVSASGAIVVASVNEIALSYQISEDSTQDAEKGDAGKAFTEFTYKKDGKDVTCLAVNNFDDLGADLQDALFGTNEHSDGLRAGDGDAEKIQYDPENNILKFTNADGDKEYYSLDGTKLDPEGNDKDLIDGAKFKANLELYGSKKDVPDSVSTNERTELVSVNETFDKNNEGYQLVAGNDGLYTLYLNGKEQQRYIVDEALKYGGTDATGQTAGPNYLQDCLRNGKYSIQQFINDENNDDGYRWSTISWDATANIKDSYYQEDDDAAKAKYDRLQNEIQAQDKKLELELDQIETQRQAITTEEESVKKVINENIEGTFNAFG